MRECLTDVFDLDGLLEVQRQIASRTIRIVEVETSEPSPFARSLLFGYVGTFVYEGDVPLAEKRAAALSLDATLLAELLGKDGLKQLLDAEVIASIETDLQGLSVERQDLQLGAAFRSDTHGGPVHSHGTGGADRARPRPPGRAAAVDHGPARGRGADRRRADDRRRRGCAAVARWPGYSGAARGGGELRRSGDPADRGSRVALGSDPRAVRGCVHCSAVRAGPRGGR